MKKPSTFLTILTVIFSSCFASTVCGQRFTIPVFPDTQTEIRYQPEMFYSQIDWIVTHKDSAQIPIVLHVGDVVDIDVPEEWEIASDGFDKLDEAAIPYAIVPGNHDNLAHDNRPVSKNRRDALSGENEGIRITEKFNSYFPPHRFKSQRGRFERDKSDNAYYTFRAGGLNWLVLGLEFGPGMAVINWANQVVSSFPEYNVIVLTHYFLRESPGGGILGNDTHFGANRSPKELDSLLIKNHKNILMVISGHTNETAWRIGTGNEGNQVYEILQDFQKKTYDYGGGYLRLLTIDPEEKTISGKMYSPFFKKDKGKATEFSFPNVQFVGAGD